jgi:hypothetical protein
MGKARGAVSEIVRFNEREVLRWHTPRFGAYTILPDAPPAFSDEQITAIMNAAQPLAPGDRAAFLEAVVAALDGRAIGDGAVFRAIRAVQGRYLDVPKWGTR